MEKAFAKANLENLSGTYKRYLKNAVEGCVVTRFPPEPSGYLHIGHVKAVCLNYHYAKLYKGKMIMRFDDTNPSKEKTEYEHAIIEDLRRLEIVPDAIVRTSDHFKLLQAKAAWCIERGLAYCDNTPAEEINKLRKDKKPSPLRETSVEENMRVWERMLAGECKDYCLRAKIDFLSNNGCMRDPVIFRHCDEPHQTTGTRYKLYPTYDFACPIIDSTDGVTHALRTNEYADRNPQYKWFLEKLELNPVEIEDYSRLDFKFTTLSKSKLGKLIKTGAIDGWDDPRFPTLRGILRHGMQIDNLVQFMIEQGPSKNNNLMEWDRIWAMNKNCVEPIAAKFSAIPLGSTARIVLDNLPPDHCEQEDVPLHPKNAALGVKSVSRTREVLVELEDAQRLKFDEKFLLMKWGVCQVKSIAQEEGEIICHAQYLPEDTNFKDPVRLHWLPANPQLTIQINLIELGHILTVEKPDKNKISDNNYFDSIINTESKFTTHFLTEKAVEELEVGACLQFERRCYGRVDRKEKKSTGTEIDIILIPEGRSKTTSGLSTKVDPKIIAKGVAS